jgi:hypothetical protein
MLDVKDRPEVQEKLERRIRSVEVKIINPPRPGVFVCVLGAGGSQPGSSLTDDLQLTVRLGARSWLVAVQDNVFCLWLHAA